MDRPALKGPRNPMIITRTTAGLLSVSMLVAGTLIAARPGLAQSMNANEEKGTGISGKWRGSRGLVTRGADGKVIFLYGEVQPSVVCSPLQVCDIELQAGEVVRDVLVGDTVRWKVEPATSGAVGGQAIHLIVKPSEPGLVTSMVVTTSRRTYHIQLKSHQSQYMARVGFEYPEDVSTRLADINARLEASTIPGAGVPAEHEARGSDPGDAHHGYQLRPSRANNSPGQPERVRQRNRPPPAHPAGDEAVRALRQ